MSFGQNLQFLRKMHNGMTQEELAERMGVSRQTISKWELDSAYPEINKAIELCQFFSCSMDQLIRENMNVNNEAYSDTRIEEVPALRYIRYAAISREPEDDAIRHVRDWAANLGIRDPEIIGWDFPIVSQEQINVHHMHGYAAACILSTGVECNDRLAEVILQKKHRYAVITIKEPMKSPFRLIPNAYKTLMAYIQVNGLEWNDKDCLPCFEKEYEKEGIHYMDVYMAVD